MRARDLAEPYPTVALDDQALDAARLLADRRLPGVLVVDGDGLPHAVLPASQLVRLLVPGYVLEDPSLAAVIDEAHADRMCAALEGLRVRECLPRDVPRPVTADADDTAVEVAALMASSRTPLVAVLERPRGGRPRLLGVITAANLLQHLLEVAR
ncbi:CBS domain-containing protein [Streptomyces sp. NRRL B-24484]|uniref:CBS domain-containing protein n=1 Tax=Streptomyces sp. NRRL B-24484 TaxID=1463833 RepID=UPI0004BF6BB8|nr:CBS domain-containing protein [Streptomyces sp. NRRL B-24484]